MLHIHHPKEASNKKQTMKYKGTIKNQLQERVIY